MTTCAAVYWRMDFCDCAAAVATKRNWWGSVVGAGDSAPPAVPVAWRKPLRIWWIKCYPMFRKIGDASINWTHTATCSATTFNS